MLLFFFNNKSKWIGMNESVFGMEIQRKNSFSSVKFISHSSPNQFHTRGRNFDFISFIMDFKLVFIQSVAILQILT